MSLQNLTDVHSRRYTERIEHDLYRGTVRKVRHVLFRQDSGDDAFVTVTSGHLVADRKLALHSDEDLDHLDYARRKLVALSQFRDLLFVDIREDLDLTFGTVFVLLDLCSDIEPRRSKLHFSERLRFYSLKHFPGHCDILGNHHFSLRSQVGRKLAPFEQFIDSLIALLA